MKKTIVFLFILFILIVSYLLGIRIKYSNTENVLLVGKVMGFELENVAEQEMKKRFIQTSSKKIGTITFIKENTNNFVAFGHSVGKRLETKGYCYNIELLGINKSNSNSIGIIDAVLDDSKVIGEIYDNNRNGAFGNITDENLGNYQKIETANRFDVQKGNANIYIDLDGQGLKSYQIEIEKIYHFTFGNKNIKFKITDENLIQKTGGIVQGMSGTPIIQNNKLVGAINYASTNDPKCGYAIFADKLI